MAIVKFENIDSEDKLLKYKEELIHNYNRDMNNAIRESLHEVFKIEASDVQIRKYASILSYKSFKVEKEFKDKI